MMILKLPHVAGRKLQHVSARKLQIVAPLALLLGCGSATSVQSDTGECAQSYEFGNTGCADIEGRVMDASERGVALIWVSASSLSGAQKAFSSTSQLTDSAGYFSIRVTRYSGSSPASGPDTMSLYVRALDPLSAGVGIPATRRDSALVQVELAPLGEVPEPARVTIKLPQP